MSPKTLATPRTDHLPILTFRLGEQVYALFISDVVEVEAMVERIPVLEAAPALLGLVNRHGKIVPLLDLRVVFDQPAAPITSASFFIVAAHKGQEVGLVVDSVLQVEYVNSVQLENASSSGKYIRGIISRRTELIPVIAVEPLIATYLADRQSG